MEERGHPYRIPVNNKNTLSEPKSFTVRKASTAYRFGSAVGGFAAGHQRTETSWPHRSFSHLRVLLDSFVESAGPETDSSFAGKGVSP